MHESSDVLAGQYPAGERDARRAGRDTSSPRPFDVEARAHQATPLPPELAALERAGIAPGPLYAAIEEAARCGVEPFDALLASGDFVEAELVETLARALGVDVAGPEDAAGGPIDADTFALAASTGHLAGLGADGQPRFVIAARGPAIRRLARTRRGQPRSHGVALAGPRAFADLLVARAGLALAERAAEGPRRVAPNLTVDRGMPRLGIAARIVIFAAALAVAAAAWTIEAAGGALILAAGLVFCLMNAFRLVLCLNSPREQPRAAQRRRALELPVYTVMAALYREAAVVPSLLDALERLDYPASKLDIKILTEADDEETRVALQRRPPRAGVEVITLPAGALKTKPRALNAGLLAARGELLAVFDAEDRPEPGQLREAVEAFRRLGPDLACVQARLAIDNHADGWLCRHFAIEYAALFDVVLPALAAFGLPIPLGGTSNHFRVSALKRIGGWDAGNVTEDADLGLRLARFGYRTTTIASATWEEAPTTLGVWIKQRTRWIKGFIVTAIVHGRRPVSLYRALGPLAFLSALITVGGVALTALAFPVVATLFLYNGLTGALLAPSESIAEALLVGFFLANMIIGFAVGVASGWIGIDRRCPANLWPALLTLPAYWLLVGWAAWRALLQIAKGETRHWEKTPHGVSRRRAPPDGLDVAARGQP